MVRRHRCRSAHDRKGQGRGGEEGGQGKSSAPPLLPGGGSPVTAGKAAGGGGALLSKPRVVEKEPQHLVEEMLVFPPQKALYG